MDLLSQYSLLQPLRREQLRNGEGSEFWDDFLNADGHICVVAGRRMGKTTAILKRAMMRRDKDIIIVSGHQTQNKMTADAFSDMLIQNGWQDVEITGGYRDCREFRFDDHSVSFVGTIEGYIRSWYADKEVIFHEPEGFTHIPNFRRYLEELPNMRIVMIGSLFNLEPSRFKEFHGYCVHNGYAERLSIERLPDLAERLQDERQAGWITEEAWQREYMCRWTRSTPVPVMESR